MSDRINNELAALFTPPPSRGVQFTQAKVLSWDNETLANTLEWRGISIHDVPMVEGINALTIREGDVVGMLGWAPENARGVGSWWILGKLSIPGEFIADLDITAKIFRLVTEDDHPLAFFGKEADGDPLWILYYGGADEQWAMRTLNGNDLVISYRDGVDWLRISGTIGEQIFQIRDNAGHELISSDGASDVGLARPWLNYYLQPAFEAEGVGEGATSLWPSTDSSSYTNMLRGFNTLWHPRFAYSVSTATIGGGNVEWRLRFDGVTAVSGTGAASGTADVPGWGTTTLPGHSREVILQIRTSGGATRVWAQMFRLTGRQS